MTALALQVDRQHCYRSQIHSFVRGIDEGIDTGVCSNVNTVSLRSLHSFPFWHSTAGYGCTCAMFRFRASATPQQRLSHGTLAKGFSHMAPSAAAAQRKAFANAQITCSERDSPQRPPFLVMCITRWRLMLASILVLASNTVL